MSDEATSAGGEAVDATADTSADESTDTSADEPTNGAERGGDGNGDADDSTDDAHGAAVPVEAVDDLELVLAPGTAEYVLYGGKGGVGKTTMAAATALASAESGDATLVVSTDPAHSLSDTLEVEIGATPARIREDVPLYGVEIDPEDALDEAGMFGAGGEFDLGGLGDVLGGASGAGAGGTGVGGAGAGSPGAAGGDAADAGAAGAGADDGSAGTGGAAAGLGPESLPGADEAAAMQLLLRYLDDDRFDRVVIDTAPTGHTLRLLELPEVLDGLVGQFARLRDRLGSALGTVPGFESEQGPDLDEVADRIERLRDLLRDPARTDFRVVLVPEELSVRESGRLLARLDGFGVPVETVVVNRVLEPFGDVADLEGTGVDPETFVAPDLESCAFCRRRWDVQREALASATELFRGHDVRRVPLFAEEVRGERMLRAVAACL